jgi:murein hydrolase activator
MLQVLKRYILPAVMLILAAQVLVVAQRKSSKKKVSVNQVSKEDLEAQRTAILGEIKKTQDQLKELQKDKNASLQQLTALQSKLDARQALIGNINNEISLIGDNIADATNDVDNLKLSLKDLQMHYSELIRYSYKQRTSQDMVMFIFSSKNFYEAMTRYKYVKQYRDYRKLQAEKILMASKNIKDKIFTLEQQRKQKDAFLQQQEEQRKVLAMETSQKNGVVLDLKGKEKELLSKVQNQKLVADKLNSAINAAIRREIAIARKKAEEESRRIAKEKTDRDRRERDAAIAKRKAAEEEKRRLAEEERQRKINAVTAIKNADRKRNSAATGGAIPTGKPLAGAKKPINTGTPAPTPKPVAADKPTPRYVAKTEDPTAKPSTPTSAADGSSYANDLSDESRQLSNNFEANRGYLIAPASGYICEHFGKNKHPVYNVVTENYGVDIRTSKGSQVKTVFGGEVSSVFYIAGAGNNILVNHGTYFTLYSKIDKAMVTKGQKLTARQAIGTVMTDAEGNNQVHFEIWKVGASGALQKMNPEQWIRL